MVQIMVAPNAMGHISEEKNASHRIPGSSVRLAAHRSTRVSDDALETGKTGAVSCEPNDKYEDLKTQLLKSINVGKTTNVV